MTRDLFYEYCNMFFRLWTLVYHGLDTRWKITLLIITKYWSIPTSKQLMVVYKPFFKPHNTYLVLAIPIHSFHVILCFIGSQSICLWHVCMFASDAVSLIKQSSVKYHNGQEHLIPSYLAFYAYDIRCWLEYRGPSNWTWKLKLNRPNTELTRCHFCKIQNGLERQKVRQKASNRISWEQEIIHHKCVLIAWVADRIKV